MQTAAQRTRRYEARREAQGIRKVHAFVPENRADELKAIAARMRNEHLGKLEKGHIVTDLRRMKRRLQRTGIHGLILFGSFARGEATKSSDIDLVAEFDPAAKLTLLDIVGLERDLENRFGRKVDVVSADGLKPSIGSAVIADGVRIF